MRKLNFLLFFILLTGISFSQAPGFFNYQTVLRDNTGELIKNQNITFRVTIIAGSESGSNVYQETHSAQTNEFGLCKLKIGDGSNPSSNFNLINWGLGNYFLKIELDENAGTNYTEMGTVQLLSVPYSLYANTASQAKFIDNDILYFSDSDTLFAVKDRDGNIVFAVFPDGAEIYVNQNVKGKVGGFAVSGRNPSKVGEEDYFVVTPDSTRVYVNKPVVKGKVGGFAVSGRNPSKAGEEEFLVITPDSTRIYVNQEAGKGKVGGFAVSGRNPSKSTIDNFMDITPDNYFIGHGSGSNNTTGIYNSFLGFEAGLSNTEGDRNVFIGNISGKANTTGYLNTFVGDETGTGNTTGYKNVFLGTYSGFNNTEGFANVFLGTTAGPYNTTGNRNIFIGQASGWNNDTANYNIFIGNQSGLSNQGGEYNVFLGTNSGHENYIGDYNVYIGEQTGYSNLYGSDNTYIGHNAGYQGDNGSNNVFVGSNSGYSNYGEGNVFLGSSAGYHETTSNKLYIENSQADSSEALIWGDFENNMLRINGQLGINTQPTYYSMEVVDDYGVANMVLKGIGDSYSYSRLIFMTNEETPKRWDMFYSKTGNFEFAYKDGVTWYNQMLQIEDNGNLIPGASILPLTDNTYNIGSSSLRWNDIYATNPVIQTSDKRLKTNIEDLNYGLKEILMLRPVSFKWIDNSEEGENIGLIAQEVQPIIHEVVNVGDDENNTLGIKYSSLVPVLIKGIQEQEERISKLEKENEELKQKLEEILNLLSTN